MYPKINFKYYNNLKKYITFINFIGIINFTLHLLYK